MTTLPPNDGLSAYFDGELSPDEHRAMAREIQDSERDQRELAEMRVISDELRGLPTELTSPDFLADVIKRIEGNQPVAKPRRTWRKSYVLTVLVSAAALVMAAIYLPRMTTQNPGTGDSVATIDPAENASDPETGEDIAILTPMDPAEPGTIHLGHERDLMAQKNPVMVAPKAEAAPMVNRRASDEKSLQARPRAARINTTQEEPAKQPEPELLREIRKLRANSQQAIVSVDVITEKPLQARQQLQALFRQQGVLPLDQADETKRSGSPEEKPTSSEGLFVKATAVQMRQTLTIFERLRFPATFKTNSRMGHIPLPKATAKNDQFQALVTTKESDKADAKDLKGFGATADSEIEIQSSSSLQIFFRFQRPQGNGTAGGTQEK